MKRIGMILAAAMMVGSMTVATGCKKADDKAQSDAAAQPSQATEQSSAAPAPATKDEAKVEAKVETTEAAAAGATDYAVRAHLPAPPAPRFEVRGVAPSAHHRWVGGYWRWDSPRTVYVWEPGYWQDDYAYAPYAPPPVRYEDAGYGPGADYVFVPGYWRWSGVEYVWMGGYWDHYRPGYTYWRPRYEYVNGRWAYRTYRWEASPRVDHDRWYGRRGAERQREIEGRRGFERPAVTHVERPDMGHVEHPAGRVEYPTGRVEHPAAGRSPAQHGEVRPSATHFEPRGFGASRPAVHSAPSHAGGAHHR